MAEYVIHLDGDRGTLLVDGEQPKLFGMLVGVEVRRDALDAAVLSSSPFVVHTWERPVVEVTLRLPLGATDHLTVVHGPRVDDVYGPTADGEMPMKPPEPQCWDCQAPVGEPHDDGCDVARCLWTGAQRLTCDGLDPEPHDCGNDRHTGYWPGERECIEFGWYAADGGPDLNRLHLRRQARWDRDAGRFVLAN